MLAIVVHYCVTSHHNLPSDCIIQCCIIICHACGNPLTIHYHHNGVLFGCFYSILISSTVFLALNYLMDDKKPNTDLCQLSVMWKTGDLLSKCSSHEQIIHGRVRNKPELFMLTSKNTIKHWHSWKKTWIFSLTLKLHSSICFYLLKQWWEI